MATITLTRNCSVEAGDVFRLTLTVTASTVIPQEVFVFNVGTGGVETDVYERVSTIEDFDTLGIDRTSGDTQYRAAEVTIDYDTVFEASHAKTALIERLDLLLLEYESYVTDFEVADEVVALPV